MTRKVYKYAIPAYEDEITLMMPRGAEIIHVGKQASWPQVWALVDPDAPPEPRRFRMAGTGHPIEGDVRHVGTWTEAHDTLVWHLFAIEEPRP